MAAAIVIRYLPPTSWLWQPLVAAYWAVLRAEHAAWRRRRRIQDAVRERKIVVPIEVRQLIDQTVAGTLAHVRSNTNRLPGIQPNPPGGEAAVREFRRRNVRLIRTIAAEHLAEVERIFAERGNLHPEQLRKLLQERLGVSERQARLWARDQTLKLAADVTQAKHEALGITEYEWRTSRDGNVRAMHAKLHGRKFDYSKPPVTNERGDRNNPGRDYQCRCHGDPVLPEPKPKPASKPKPAPKPKPEHTQAYWELAYWGQYTSASTPLAWGRAALERGLDRPIEKVNEVARLLGGTLAWQQVRPSNRQFEPIKGVATLRDLDARIAQEMRTADPARKRVLADDRARIHFMAATTEHVASITRGKVAGVNVDPTTPANQAQIAKSIRFFEAFARDGVVPGLRVRWVNVRAYYSPQLNEMVLDGKRTAETFAHEMGHAIEAQTDAGVAARAFLAARTRGEPEVELAELQPDRGFDPGERARPDNFFDPYCGKSYISATEITSMGLERIAHGDYQFATEDPEYFHFCLGILAGRF